MPSEKPERPIVQRITDNCFASLVIAFKQSAKFRAYAQATQDLWGRELYYISRPDTLGAVAIDIIRPKIVQEYVDGWADKPGKQAAILAVLRQLENWAIVKDMLPRSITQGVEIGELQGGHVPWSDEQVEIAIKYANPAIARAVLLGAHTGQRGSDLVRIGPTDVEIFNGLEGLRVIQVKTGREVWVPILSTLKAAMATWERQPGPFLRTPWGEPWRRTQLSSAWRYEVDTNPELGALKRAGLVMHGLRGHACVRLYRAGCTTKQVADMVGMSEPMVGRYTRKSVQRENAAAAVYHMERTIRERSIDKSKNQAS